MMTDEELDSFEEACKTTFDGMYGYSSQQYLELIAMIRQARAERDWLAQRLDFENCCVSSDLKEEPGYCLEHECKECGLSSMNAWLEAAKEATSCQK